MPLTIGSRVGSCDIVGPLGAGGMGEVYRARDTRLQRDVAVKVLPALFALDPERLARFTREAQTLAALNHPNIAQIFAISEDDATRAIVMELVDGESLASRIARGRVPPGEAVAIARQVAEALAAAHDAGIIHRDLKPANIMLRADGTVKVLDFGLAKILDPVASASDAAAVGAETSTLTSPALTRAGVILGTAAYLSPEQARGLPVDKRTDVWAFGCVLFEMLAGQRAFAGATISDSIAKILERDPDWTLLPGETPPRVLRLLRRALAKNPRQRLRDAGDAALELQEADEPASVGTTARMAGWLPLAIVSVLLIAATLIAVREKFFRAPPAVPAWALGTVSFEVEPPYFGLQLAMSADGATVAWPSVSADGQRRLAVRMLRSSASREIPGTEGVTYPFLAPDGHAAGFFSGGELKRVDFASGTLQVLAQTPGVSLGGSWSGNDVIVFSNRYGLQAMPASGGPAHEVASLDRSRQENSLRFPHFLPDGRHFLYVSRSGRPQQNAAYLGSLDEKPRRLFATMSPVQFAPPDYLLFLRGTTLVAQKFDVRSGAATGEAVPIVTGVGANTLGVGAAFAASAAGALVYGTTGPETWVSLQWMDRAGKPIAPLAAAGQYTTFRIAPDGRRVVVGAGDERTGSRSVWVHESGRTPARLTLPSTNDWQPVWSHDGTRIAFSSYRDGPLDVYIKPASGAGADVPLLVSSDQKDVSDWSHDGRYVLIRETQRNLKGDVVAIDVSDPKRRIAVARADADERAGRFSPDGHWVAYVSDETGRPEVWVQPFPPTGAKWQVSVAGADEPAWARGGGEILYLDRAGALMAAPVLRRSEAFAVGPPVPLFNAGRAIANVGLQRYEPAADGTRFLVAVSEPHAAARPTVVLNWPALLPRAWTDRAR
jgi:aminoglycoside phosphotransferase (APT) family kinase protein